VRDLTIEIGYIFRRMLEILRHNRYLWLFAFLIAFSGAASQSYSLSFSSPIPRGFTAFSPWHKAGEKLTSFANLHMPLKVFLIIVAVIIGLAMLALRAFAEGSAIGGVADLEAERPSGIRSAARHGWAAFFRYVAIVVLYAILSAALSVPSVLYMNAFKNSKQFVLPCLGGIVLGVGFIIVVLFAGILVQLAERFVVLEGAAVFASIGQAFNAFKDYWRDVLVTWAVVLGINVASLIVSLIVLGIISWPFTWLFKVSYNHHSVPLASLAILAFFVLWGIVSVVIGAFALASNTTWTLSFLQIEPVALPTRSSKAF
jgi:hypothetical protein